MAVAKTSVVKAVAIAGCVNHDQSCSSAWGHERLPRGACAVAAVSCAARRIASLSAAGGVSAASGA
ncbi:MAG: hypothetical protein JSW36_07755 [Burkholderiales bacterium]|nr:MAG: hypothetical protein JSW36_07755 [Burkholderiales bacterium]